MRSRRTSLVSLSRSRSIPLSSTTNPDESEHATTLPPNSWIFSIAYIATLPDPDTTSRRPSKLVPLERSRSEEHTPELQSLMRSSYALYCLKQKKEKITYNPPTTHQYTKP